MQDEGEITRLLGKIRQGDSEALDRMLPLVYNELHGMAQRQLRRGRRGQTLNTTALVHEAYLKLVDGERADWNDRRHFLAVAATAMRSIVVDYARRKTAKKRGSAAPHSLLDEARIGVEERSAEILALDEALVALSRVDERLSRIVELRYFGGLTVEEIAAVMEVSDRTVKRDWRKARALLYRMLTESRA